MPPKRRRKAPLFFIISIVVALLVIAGIFVEINRSASTVSMPTIASTTNPRNNAPHFIFSNFSEVEAMAITAQIKSIPNSVYNAVGTGNGKVAGLPEAIAGTPLTKSGKPELLYMGTEWCPYCASERWAIAVALSRFGTLSGLVLGKSSSTDMYPNTPTLFMTSVSYSSRYITFVSVEIQGRNHQSLKIPTPFQESIFSMYDKQGAIPFVDIGNRWESAASYSPQAIMGMTSTEVANSLSNASLPQTKAILGSANFLTAAICSTDNFQPTSVCTSSGVAKAAGVLGIHGP